jgi:hypothetical protein
VKAPQNRLCLGLTYDFQFALNIPPCEVGIIEAIIRAKAEGFAGSNVTAEGSYKFAGGDGEFRGLTGGGRFKTVLKSETEVECSRGKQMRVGQGSDALRACRDVNHNFQPQRSHLKCSSGFSLDAVLPQRGHFIVHICVKGPSGVTFKIWNVDSIVASSIDVSSASVGMLFGLCALPVPRRLMEKLALQNQSVEVSRVLCRIQNERHDTR